MEKKKKVLFIDPDLKFMREISTLFTGELITDSSRGIIEAISKIKTMKYDCVIMDVDLLELKGYAAVSIIKAIDANVPVILTSNENTFELEAKVRTQDIFYYYLKSFEKEELKLVVYSALKKSFSANQKSN